MTFPCSINYYSFDPHTLWQDVSDGEQEAHRVRKSLEEEELCSEISETSYCHPAGANPA